MRLFILIILFFTSQLVQAQKDTIASKAADTVKRVTDARAPYQKNPVLPTFSIQLQDSSWFFNTHLKPKKPVLLLYFSPDCGHCQTETEDIMSKMQSLGELQIVMITSRPFEDMVKFIKHYKLDKFPSITVGKDHARFIPRFFDVRMTPFSALYDKKGKLVKAYQKGVDLQELIRLVN